jgi:putative ABC transport system permease protein
LVSDGAFAVLGLPPIAGRPFTKADHQPGAARVLALAHHTWLARYGGDPSVVGRAVQLNGAPATIVAVLPPRADVLVRDVDWWAPVALDAKDRANIGPRYLDVIGRIGDGGSVDVARQELDAIGRSLDLRAEDGSLLGVAITPLQQHLTASYAAALQLLLGGVIVLVIIAASNAAGLLLTRAHDRAGEFTLRMSLGAGRGRLMRQLIVETGAVVVAALAAGTIMALWLTDLLRFVLPADMPRVGEARVDALVVAFLTAIAFVVTLLMSVVPARYASRANLNAVLRSSTGGATKTLRGRTTFVVAQIALAVFLGGCAMLLIATTRALETEPRGYDARGVFSTSINLPAQQYRDSAAIASAINRIVDAAAAIPGVQIASASSQVPFAGGSPGADVILADGSFDAGGDNQVRVRIVAPGYLQTMGVRIREGRDIARTDTGTSQPVVVINTTLARRLTSDQSPLGRAVKFRIPVFNGADGKRVWTIVGVAEDTRDRGPRESAPPEVLIAAAQTPSDVFFWIGRELQLGVRTSGDAKAVAGGVRRAVTSVDPAIGIGAATTLEDRIDAAFARERRLAQLLTVVGVTGFILAIVGLLALVHHHVRQRRRELAIRVALGASTTRIVRPVVAGGLRLALVGAAIGSAGQIIFAPLFASLLFGVAPGDIRLLIAVAVGMIAVSAVAVWIPARQAASVNPSDALRS